MSTELPLQASGEGFYDLIHQKCPLSKLLLLIRDMWLSNTHSKCLVGLLSLLNYKQYNRYFKMLKWKSVKHTVGVVEHLAMLA